MTTNTLVLTGTRTNERLGAVLVAAFLGLGLVFMAGFAPGDGAAQRGARLPAHARTSPATERLRLRQTLP